MLELGYTRSEIMKSTNMFGTTIYKYEKEDMHARMALLESNCSEESYKEFDKYILKITVEKILNLLMNVR